MASIKSIWPAPSRYFFRNQHSLVSIYPTLKIYKGKFFPLPPTSGNTAQELLYERTTLSVRGDTWLMSDDAHGLGVVGGGRGSNFVQAVPADVPLQMGTLSKALGSYGGYVCASAAVVDLIRNRARTAVYSTALPPAMAAAALAALDVIEREPGYAALPSGKGEGVCAQGRAARAGQPDRSRRARRGRDGAGRIEDAGRRGFPGCRHKAPDRAGRDRSSASDLHRATSR